eukprot:764865-Hanusia_phi.AAC.2
MRDEIKVANVSAAKGVVGSGRTLSDVVDGRASVKNVKVDKLDFWVLLDKCLQHMATYEAASASEQNALGLVLHPGNTSLQGTA